MKPGRAVVIGAGVVGAWSAYWLAREGWHVELIDQGKFGDACSAGNCGLVCPSHILPLCAPGAIRKTLPLLLKRNSPFTIRFRPDPALISWLWRFSRNCREDLMWQTGAALHALLQESHREYETIIRECGLDCAWQPVGGMFVYDDEHHLHAFSKTNDQLVRRFGVGAELLDARALAAAEPALNEGPAGAWLYRCDSFLHPNGFLAEFRRVLERVGVVIREQCPATGVVAGSGSITSISTPQGPLAADSFVFSTGSWSPLLSDMLGVRLPIQPGKGYSLTSTAPPSVPRYSVIFENARVAVTPMGKVFRVGSTMEFAGHDESIRPERLELLRAAARKYLRQPYQPSEEHRWWGWRPMTPDGKPFIDFSPRYSNAVIAAGHNMVGMSTGPATGRLACELIAGQSPFTDPSPFRIAGRC